MALYITARLQSELKINKEVSDCLACLSHSSHTLALCELSHSKNGLSRTNCIFPILTVPMCSRPLIAFLSFFWQNHNESALFVCFLIIYPDT